MEIKMHDGSTFSGTIEQCIAFSKAMGLHGSDATATLTPKRDERVWHWSESKGAWIRITDMNTVYLRNTVLKIIKLWREDVENAKSPSEMVNLIVNNGDVHLAALCKELNTRTGW